MSGEAGGGTVTVGAAVRRTGVSAEMIRRHEEAGLPPPAARSGSGCRHGRPADLHTLRFVRRARDLGFSVEAMPLGRCTQSARCLLAGERSPTSLPPTPVGEPRPLTTLQSAVFSPYRSPGSPSVSGCCG